MLKKRILTAAIIVPIILAAILLLPSTLFLLFSGVIVLLAAWEWAKLMEWTTPIKRVSYVVFIAVLMYLARFYFTPHWYWAALIWWVMAFGFVIGFPASAKWWAKGSIVRGLMGILTLVPAWLAINQLHHAKGGGHLLLILILTISIADIGAYFGGKRFGTRPLAKRVSPGKTVEGVVCAVFAVNVFAMLTIWLVPLGGEQYLGWYFLLLFVGLISVVGDLTISMLKRHVGLKDSGRILPGHGGILDRIDGYTAGAPIFALGLSLLGLL